MSRGNKQIDGQLTFDFCLDAGNFVVQSNNLILGKQSLKLNSAKLIRSAIMQIIPEDEELKPYVITISELSSLLGVPASNLYRDIEEITDDILTHPVFIKEESKNKIRWVKIPWVQRCEYRSDIGVAIKLNNELRPFLINLQKNYAQYPLDSILAMKSVYAIRLFELLQEKIKLRKLPANGICVELSLDTIRQCCGVEDMKSYQLFSNLKQRILDVAVQEINRTTLFNVDYGYIKKGRSVTKIKFHVNMKYH